MAEFTPSKKTAQDFNNGIEYIDGQGNETGDVVSAETINNLVESALYTQEQAEGAKQTAEGALEQVEHVIADKTLLLDVQKNHYNLGAYDTYVSNDDGTGTITRETGYFAITPDTNMQKVTNPAGLTYYIVKLPGLVDLTGHGARNLRPNRGLVHDCWSAEAYPPTGQIYYMHETTRIDLMADDGSKEKLFEKPIVVEYHLDTAHRYTEQVIKNQPIRPANQDEEYYWHEEWRKGLNLADIEDRQGRYWVSSQSDITAIINKLEPGTYNLSCDITPLSLDSGQSIGNQFTWVQVTKGHYSGDGVFAHTTYLSLNSTVRSVLTFEKKANYSNYEFRLWGLGNHSSGNNGEILVSNFMLVEGSHPYPYKPYYGGIVREKDLSGIRLFPTDVNPAQTIGGDWEDKGTVTTSDNTVFHAYRRLN